MSGNPVVYSIYIQPIALEAPGVILEDGHPVVVAGWGTLKENGPLPDTLRYVEIEISGQEECRKPYGWVKPGSGMICAGVVTGGKDSCQGDSGGPLWREDQDTNQLIQVED